MQPDSVLVHAYVQALSFTPGWLAVVAMVLVCAVVDAVLAWRERRRDR